MVQLSTTLSLGSTPLTCIKQLEGLLNIADQVS